MKCPYCGFESSTLLGLKAHIRRIHDTQMCPVCGRRVKKLRIHLSKHDDEAHRRVYAIIGNSYSQPSNKLKNARDEFYADAD
jgi:transcription elongation factor Elf1